MSEYHVGCGAFGIYAGTLNSRNKNLWQNKTECTDEAISAVAQYLLQENKCMKFDYNGGKHKLAVIECGEWIYNIDDFTLAFRCSCCKYNLPMIAGQNVEQSPRNFCPNCGADMSLKEEENE